jgi:hypothetical protein
MCAAVAVPFYYNEIPRPTTEKSPSREILLKRVISFKKNIG